MTTINMALEMKLGEGEAINEILERALLRVLQVASMCPTDLVIGCGSFETEIDVWEFKYELVQRSRHGKNPLLATGYRRGDTGAAAAERRVLDAATAWHEKPGKETALILHGMVAQLLARGGGEIGETLDPYSALGRTFRVTNTRDDPSFPQPETSSAPAAPKPPRTFQDVRRLLIKVRDVLGRDVAKEIMKKTGHAERMPEIRPQDYAAVIDACFGKLQAAGVARRRAKPATEGAPTGRK